MCCELSAVGPACTPPAGPAWAPSPRRSPPRWPPEPRAGPAGSAPDCSPATSGGRDETQETAPGVHRAEAARGHASLLGGDRKSTRLNSSHVAISYAVFCLKKKTNRRQIGLRNHRPSLRGTHVGQTDV